MKNIKDFKEVEFKYDANKIKLVDFLSLMNKISKEVRPSDLKYIEASSADIYYRDIDDKIVRLRNSKTPQLTIKRRTSDKNNEHRIEVNLDLNSDLFGVPHFESELEAFAFLLSTSVDSCRNLVSAISSAHQEQRDYSDVLNLFLNEIGYQENFKIYKICEIFFMEDINFVYYKVLDKNMECLDNFIEIEYDEKKALSMTAPACIEILEKWEHKLKPLGITSKSRLSDSLYDIYKQPFNQKKLNSDKPKQSKKK